MPAVYEPVVDNRPVHGLHGIRVCREKAEKYADAHQHEKHGQGKKRQFEGLWFAGTAIP